MKNLVIGLLIGAFFLAACGGTPPLTQPTPASRVDNSTSTPSPLPTSTATPTHTPRPTETLTLTPTETVFALDPSFVVTDKNGAPVLVDGRAQFNFEMDYDKLPDVKDLETLSGYEAWSPDFIRWLHNDYIPKLQVQGSPLITPFDANTVCQIPWIAPPKPDTMAYISLHFKDGVVCKTGTFPVRKVFAVRDDERGFYTVTQQIYDPESQQFIYRTTAVTQPFWSILQVLMRENTYFGYSYGFNEELTGRGYPVRAVSALHDLHLSSGETLYDPILNDEAYADGGVFNPRFADHLTVGLNHVGIVVSD